MHSSLLPVHVPMGKLIMRYYSRSTYLFTVVDSGNRTEWERQREREEFARTAHVVQPLGSSLTSKFTRSQDNTATEESAMEEVQA